MSLNRLLRQVDQELSQLRLVVSELKSLQDDVRLREPTLREIVAAGASTSLHTELRHYLGFRHIARMGYGVDLDWERVAVGIKKIESVFDDFESSLSVSLKNLE